MLLFTVCVHSFFPFLIEIDTPATSEQQSETQNTPDSLVDQHHH